MTFDPSKSFEKIEPFDPSKPFEKVESSFDPAKTYEVIDENKPDKALFKSKVIVGKEEEKPEVIDSSKVLEIVKSELKKFPKPEKSVDKVIQKEIIREVPKEDKRKLVEEKTVNEIKLEIEALKEKLKQTQETLPFLGGSGVIGLPNPAGQSGKFVTTDGSMIKWGVAASSSGVNIGDAIGSGIANRVLYIDSSTNLAQSPNLTFDGTTLQATDAIFSDIGGRLLQLIGTNISQDASMSIVSARVGFKIWALQQGDATYPDAFKIRDLSDSLDVMVLRSGGQVGIGVLNPTAFLMLPAGTASASTAPLKFTSGIVNTTPEAGAIEFDGSNFYAVI
jgi:hypothetical protein